MKKRLIFCALIMCALCGGYNDVMAALPDPAEEGTVFHSNVVVVRRDTLNENEADLDEECKKTLTQRNAIYHPANGTLPGMFSVAWLNPTTHERDSFGMDKQYVRFSKSNLQYMPESYQGPACGRFTEHQYDMIKSPLLSTPSKYDTIANKWYDLFCSSDTPDMWKTIPILNGGGQPDVWDLLTDAEWNFLVARTNRGTPLWFIGKILLDETTSVCGIFLFPDEFPVQDVTIQDVTAPDQTISIVPWCGMTGNGILKQTMSLSDFERLEQMGMVFLPATGLFWKGQMRHINHDTVYLKTGTTNHCITTSNYKITVGSSGFEPSDYLPVRLVQRVTY